MRFSTAGSRQVRSFQLHEPSSVAGAVEALSQFGSEAKALAGGTDLVAGMMKNVVVGKALPYPRHLLDLSTVPGLHGIRLDSAGAVVGAMTTLTEIAESPDLRQRWPVLADAAESIAYPGIRNLGTVGGNLNQRPRCWFFRTPGFDCLKKGGDVCFAPEGDNRYNAMLGGQGCYIVHPSDLAPALVSLGASVLVRSPRGTRTVSIDDYFVGPETDVLRETVLEPDELLVEVNVPSLPSGTPTAWTKLKDREGPGFALASAAVVIDADHGVWKGGRIVLGGVAPIPYRATIIEEALMGKDIRATIADAARRIRDVAQPLSMNRYKVDLAEAVIERTVLAALEM